MKFFSESQLFKRITEHLTNTLYPNDAKINFLIIEFQLIQKIMAFFFFMKPRTASLIYAIFSPFFYIENLQFVEILKTNLKPKNEIEVPKIKMFYIDTFNLSCFMCQYNYPDFNYVNDQTTCSFKLIFNDIEKINIDYFLRYFNKFLIICEQFISSNRVCDYDNNNLKNRANIYNSLIEQYYASNIWGHLSASELILSNYQKSILLGCLGSDGYIPNGSKKIHFSQAKLHMYYFNETCVEFCNFIGRSCVRNTLGEHGSGQPNHCDLTSISHSYVEMLKKDWYQPKKKIPQSCLNIFNEVVFVNWVCGDGGVCMDGGLKICTQGYDRNCCENLSTKIISLFKLDKNSVYPSPVRKNSVKEFVVYITKESLDKIFEKLISKTHIPSGFLYKFDNKIPKDIKKYTLNVKLNQSGHLNDFLIRNMGQNSLFRLYRDISNPTKPFTIYYYYLLLLLFIYY